MASVREMFGRVRLCLVRAATVCAALTTATHVWAQEDCPTAVITAPGTTFFSTFGFASDGPSNCGQMGSDVWFRFTADLTGTAIISTCGQTFMDTVLNAYDDCPPKGNSLVCLDDFCDLQTEIQFAVVAGRDYLLQLGGFAGEQGDGSFTITLRLNGACCVGGDCSSMSERGCLDAGGVYLGDGSNCSLCAQLGACCLPPEEGLCRLMLESACASAGGTFSGVGTSCAGVGPLPGAALQFDGVTGHVAIGNPKALNFAGTITIEAWVKPEATDGLRNIVMHGYTLDPNGETGMRIQNGNYQIFSWDGFDHLAAAPVPEGDVGRWVHLAGTFDGSSWRLYRNGVPIAETFEFTGALQMETDWAIGSRGTGTERFFDGGIDEVRIWNIARTQQEIADNLDNTLTGSEPGLVAYWRLDEGAGEVAVDLAGDNDGTLEDGVNWIVTQTCGSAPFGACCLPSGQCVLASASGCGQSGGIYSGDGTPCGSVDCPQPGACCLSATQGVCQFVVAPRCAALGGVFRGEGTSCDGVGPLVGAAVEFDGVNDVIAIGNPPALNFTGNVTMEAWVKPNAGDGLRNIVMHGYTFSPFAGEMGLRIQSGRYEVLSWDGNSHAASAPVPEGDFGNWVHLAGTHDGTAWRLYRNGVQVAETIDSTGAVLVEEGWGIGAHAQGNQRLFDGAIDDVRIWNVARTQQQIAANFAGPLTGSEPGLVGYWRLDEGAGLMALDSAGDSDGTLTNGPEWLSTGPCCPADFNADGLPNSQDFFDFLTAFFTGDPSADFNRSGSINSQDFFDFLAAFFTGC